MKQTILISLALMMLSTVACKNESKNLEFEPQVQETQEENVAVSDLDKAIIALNALNLEMIQQEALRAKRDQVITTIEEAQDALDMETNSFFREEMTKYITENMEELNSIDEDLAQGDELIEAKRAIYEGLVERLSVEDRNTLTEKAEGIRAHLNSQVQFEAIKTMRDYIATRVQALEVEIEAKRQSLSSLEDDHGLQGALRAEILDLQEELDLAQERLAIALTLESLAQPEADGV